MTELELRNLYVDTARSYYGANEADGSHKPIIDLYNSYKPLPRSYKMKYTDHWCATFVSAIAIKLGLTDIIPAECSCSKMIELHKALGTWQESDSYTPQPGDLILYDWDDSGSGDNRGNPEHIGIVVRVTDGVIRVIEGNMNEKVGHRDVKVNGRYIRGYCVPNFASKAVSKPSNLDAVAMEVIGGKWGNNPQRKADLTAAGYDYKAVQNRVNEIIERTVQEVIDGKWGNNPERKRKLEAAGFDPQYIQILVNDKLSK